MPGELCVIHIKMSAATLELQMSPLAKVIFYPHKLGMLNTAQLDYTQTYNFDTQKPI